MPDKDFKIRFAAQDDGTFGSTVRRAQAELTALKGIAGQVGSQIAGGLIGGGAVGVVMTVIDKVASLVRETAELADKAKDLSIPLKGVRGISSTAGFIGLNSDSALGAAGQVAQARAEAIAGRDEFVKSFQAIGLSLKQISDLSPEELFYRVNEQFKGIKLSAETKLAAGSLYGSFSDQILPYVIGGTSFRTGKSEFSRTLLGGTFSSLSGAALRLVYGARGSGNPFKGDTDPVSTFPLERAQQVAKLTEQNRFRAAEIARSQLPVEQQINDVLAQRVQIERDLQGAPSELRRQQLIGRLLDADQSLATLRARQLGTGTPDIKGAGLQRNLDDLSRAGFFTNGSPVALGNIQADQLKELKEIVNQLRKAPAETARAL